MSTQAIADHPYISSSTVKNDMNHVLARLDVHTRAQAIVVAPERRVVALGD